MLSETGCEGLEAKKDDGVFGIDPIYGLGLAGCFLVVDLHFARGPDGVESIDDFEGRGVEVGDFIIG